MKKIICAVLCLLLVCLTAVPAVAAPESPEITMQPQNYHYPEYSVACYTVKASGSNLSCTWYLEYEGKTYNLSDNTNAMEPWEGYAGENYGGSQLDDNTFMWFFGGIESGLNGAQIWCVVEDGHNDVTSDRAIITVQGDAMPPEILEMPAAITVSMGDLLDIRCLAKAPEGTQLEYIWYETSTGKLPDIRAISPEETDDFIFVSTDTPGVRYFVCGITTSAGGRAYSSVVPVTVLNTSQETIPDMEILTTSLPDATVGQPYEAALQCNDPSGSFIAYYNPGGANQLEDSGLSISKNVLSGTPAKAGTFKFTLCAAGDYGEDYREYTLTVKEGAAVPTEPEETVLPTEPDATTPDVTVPDASEAPVPTETAVDISAPQPEPADEGFPWWGFVLISLVSIAAGIGVAVLIMKKKK